MDDVPVTGPAELAAKLRGGLELDADGAPVTPFVAVDLSAPATSGAVAELAAVLAGPLTCVVVGYAPDGVAAGLDPVVAALDTTITGTRTLDTGDSTGTSSKRSEWTVARADPFIALSGLAATVGLAPRAAIALTGLLRVTAALDVPAGLLAESAVYSMLQGGPEFREWRRRTPMRATAPADADPIVLSRDGPHLAVELNRPARHNALDQTMRDALIDAFDLVVADSSLRSVALSGRGASFCSGGDLAEFGLSLDAPTAHLVRIDRSVAARLHRCRDRVTARIHGSCLGAGIELAASCARVVASPDTVLRLPEVALGLVPGAGGCVSLPRRIGRWRTAWLALSGTALDARTALEWGLVDAVE